MPPDTLIEVQARLHRLERQNRILILLLLAVAGIGSIAATHHTTGPSEIRTSHLIIVDNHGTVMSDTQGVDGVVYIKKYANQVTN